MKTIIICLVLFLTFQDNTNKVTTIKIKYDTLDYFNGEYWVLYKLTNDSLCWLPKVNKLKIGDTINLKR